MLIGAASPTSVLLRAAGVYRASAGRRDLDMCVAHFIFWFALVRYDDGSSVTMA